LAHACQYRMIGTPGKLVQEVEVADVPGHYAGTDTLRLKIDERIVEVLTTGERASKLV
jgi:hypothetical protein